MRRLIRRSVVFLLPVVIYAFGKFQGGFVPWFLFAVSLVLAVYEAAVAFFALRGLEVERSLSARRLTAGDRLTVIITCRRSSRFPGTWLFFRDIGDLAERGGERKGDLQFPGWERELEYSYTLNRLPRGRHRFKEIEAISGDILGLMQICSRFSQADEVTVYPEVQQIRHWETVNERNGGHTHTIHRMSEDVTSVVGVRDYTGRERMNRIHWKATARGQGLKVKEFEHQVIHDRMFLLDCGHSRYAGEGDPVFERAVSLAATLIHFSVGRRFNTGLAAWGKTPIQLPLGRSRDHLIRLFEPLALVEPDGTRTLAECLARQVDTLPRGATLVVITPRLLEADVRTVAELTIRGVKLELFLVCAGDVSPAERARLGELAAWGVRCRPVRGDDFDEMLRGGVKNGSTTA